MSDKLRKKSHIVVVGNEKGGAGKSTVSFHIATVLLRQGLSVVTIDLDARQATFSRYVENRVSYMERHNIDLPVPIHHRFAIDHGSDLDSINLEAEERLNNFLRLHVETADVIVIDCPGADTYVSRLAHVYADTLITPINDSFVDLDVLAQVDPDDLAVAQPSHYSELIWEIRKIRAARGRPPLNWIVTRNRLSNLYSHNKANVLKVLEHLSDRLDFKLTTGFAERVVFRELFLKGLTVFDLKDATDIEITMSHLAARKEFEGLLQLLQSDVDLTTEQQKTPNVTSNVNVKADEDQDNAQNIAVDVGPPVLKKVSNDN